MSLIYSGILYSFILGLILNIYIGYTYIGLIWNNIWHMAYSFYDETLHQKSHILLQKSHIYSEKQNLTSHGLFVLMNTATNEW